MWTFTWLRLHSRDNLPVMLLLRLYRNIPNPGIPLMNHTTLRVTLTQLVLMVAIMCNQGRTEHHMLIRIFTGV